MADDFPSKGNIEAQRVWLRIVRAIDPLRTVREAETKQWVATMSFQEALDESPKGSSRP
jgi:hypothetical protein